MTTLEAGGNDWGNVAVLEQDLEQISDTDAGGRDAVLVDERLVITEAGVFACRLRGGCNNRSVCVPQQACNPNNNK